MNQPTISQSILGVIESLNGKVINDDITVITKNREITVKYDTKKSSCRHASIEYLDDGTFDVSIFRVSHGSGQAIHFVTNCPEHLIGRAIEAQRKRCADKLKTPTTSMPHPLS